MVTRRLLLRTMCKSCDNTITPSGNIQNPNIGKKPNTPPTMSREPAVMRP